MKIKKAKKKFVKWLKEESVGTFENIHEYKGNNGFWDYYSHITSTVKGNYYSAIFKQHKGEVCIYCECGNVIYQDLSIEEFFKIVN